MEGALLRSSFISLQSQERSGGFRERILSDRAFFREGKAGAWRNTLSESQVKRIVGRHGAVMQRFGYLYQGWSSNRMSQLPDTFLSAPYVFILGPGLKGWPGVRVFTLRLGGVCVVRSDLATL